MLSLFGEMLCGVLCIIWVVMLKFVVFSVLLVIVMLLKGMMGFWLLCSSRIGGLLCICFVSFLGFSRWFEKLIMFVSVVFCWGVIFSDIIVFCEKFISVRWFGVMFLVVSIVLMKVLILVNDVLVEVCVCFGLELFIYGIGNYWKFMGLFM